MQPSNVTSGGRNLQNEMQQIINYGSYDNLAETLILGNDVLKGLSLKLWVLF